MGNSCADSAAGRAASWVTPSKDDHQSFSQLLKKATLVQDRLVQAGLDGVDETPGPPRPPRVRKAPTSLRSLAASLGHEIVVLGGARGVWRCTNCFSNATYAARREWLALGPCAPLEPGCSSPQGRVWVGAGALHPSHRLSWYERSGAWVCYRCGGVGALRTRRLRAPCVPPTSQGKQVLTAVRKGLPLSVSTCDARVSASPGATAEGPKRTCCGRAGGSDLAVPPVLLHVAAADPAPRSGGSVRWRAFCARVKGKARPPLAKRTADGARSVRRRLRGKQPDPSIVIG